MEGVGMCRGIIVAFCLILPCLVLAPPAAANGGPLWALVSTEVDETLNGTGFMDRQMLRLWPSDFHWSGSPSDIFFDPGAIFGVETGLDAFHIRDGKYYFSTEVDVIPTVSGLGASGGGPLYRDEELLEYDPGTGLVQSFFDVKAVLGKDYGLDAITALDFEGKTYWAFSTEVGGTALFDEGIESFTGGDILVWSDQDPTLHLLNLEQIFGREVGLDALHAWIEPTAAGAPMLEVCMSTEVDGTLRVPDSDLASLIDFKDEDILQLTFLLDGSDTFQYGSLVWVGAEAFGRDVGLDALYLEMVVPEPATMLLAGLGLGALALRFRKRK
jgi:hypothetical protein